MDLDNIKRGLRAEIKRRENEQYLTFQCNVRQMCKDVLAKLEEQESEIAELKAQKAQAEDDCAFWKTRAQKTADDNLVMAKQLAEKDKEIRRLRRALYKACANWAHFAVAFFSSYATKEKWSKMFSKCLKKAEEYGG